MAGPKVVLQRLASLRNAEYSRAAEEERRGRVSHEALERERNEDGCGGDDERHKADVLEMPVLMSTVRVSAIGRKNAR